MLLELRTLSTKTGNPNVSFQKDILGDINIKNILKGKLHQVQQINGGGGKPVMLQQEKG